MYLATPKRYTPAKSTFGTFGKLSTSNLNKVLKTAPNVSKSIAHISKTYSAPLFRNQPKAIASYSEFFRQESKNWNQRREFASETLSEQPRKGGMLKWLILLLLGALYGVYSLKPKEGGAGVEPNSPRNALTEFQDTRILFQNKSTSEIWFNLIIFKMCSMNLFVEQGPKLLAAAEQYGIAAPMYWFIKRTFYTQFCAGETVEEAQNTIARLKKQGVRAMLDYSTEDAMTVEAWNGNCDRVIKTLSQHDLIGFEVIPIKVTAMISPNLLERMADLLNYQKLNPDTNVAPWNPLTPAMKKRLSESKVKPTVKSVPEPLTAAEQADLANFMKRMDKIGEAATSYNVRLLIDAEQTYRQPALDWIAIQTQKKFNKTQPLIYNTYQFYLQITPQTLQEHYTFAKENNFMLAAKCVRGAYIVGESARAKALEYPNPIFGTKVETDAAYDTGVKFLLWKISGGENLGVVVATHNLSSVIQAMQFMKTQKIPPSHANISFAQLKGMADNLTLGLAHFNCNAFKLLPYGPMESVMPYLTRRLQENKDVMGGVQLERHLLWQELVRRNFGFSN